MQNIAEGRKIRWILLVFRDEIRCNKGEMKGFCWVSPLRTCEMVTAITISLLLEEGNHQLCWWKLRLKL